MASQAPYVEADCVVVGAGYAGLAAALWLTDKGHTVAVLEARDRVGGRVYSKTLEDGTWLDFGGTWFGPGQDYSYGLAKEMKVSTYPTYNEGDSILVLPDGTMVRNAESFPLSELLSAGAALLAVEALEEMSKEVPLATPWDAPRAKEWDQQTMSAWIDSQIDASDATARLALRSLFTSFFCSDTSEVSLLDALHLLHSHGGIVKLLATQGGDQQDRIMGGAQAIAEKIKTRLGAALHLNAPVRQIRQDHGGVEAVADTVTVRAKRAIVAVPAAIASHLRYEPRLPSERSLFVQRTPIGSVIKILAKYDEPFWRAEGLSGQSFAISDPVRTTLDGCTDKKRPGLMIAFAFGPDARALGKLSQADRRQIFLDALATRFGAPALTPTDYWEHDWAEDPWAGGGMFGHFPPGVLTSFGPVLREPFGRIHWAGTETSTAFHGSINGAIESGQRAAQEVLAAP